MALAENFHLGVTKSLSQAVIHSIMLKEVSILNFDLGNEMNQATPKSQVFAEAIAFAIKHESKMARDIGKALEEGHFAEPWPIGQTIGPVKDRQDPNGMIMRGGKVIAQWGDTARVDMTFSATKSYLALCAGLAIDDGLIPDVHDPVRLLVDDGGFDSEQNSDITWAQLLQLTSEWEGTLWDKPDWVDHNRDLSSKPGEAGDKGQIRQMQRPGTHWEYNDVRVNRLSLALMRVFRRPLPEVLKERIMDPLGASDNWAWYGYNNSTIAIDGRQMQSVSGGAHWGGGLWISSVDHAKVGQLMLNSGKWNGQQLISESWMKACCTPCPLNQGYGYFWWLNPNGETFPAASRSSVFMIGVGTNLVWIDPENDLVAVARWLQKERVNGFIEKVMAAL
jgi:CubicO group peptidase (beta-lactamase class C family)